MDKLCAAAASSQAGPTVRSYLLTALTKLAARQVLAQQQQGSLLAGGQQGARGEGARTCGARPRVACLLGVQLPGRPRSHTHTHAHTHTHFHAAGSHPACAHTCVCTRARTHAWPHARKAGGAAAQPDKALVPEAAEQLRQAASSRSAELQQRAHEAQALLRCVCVCLFVCLWWWW
jgi:hypothetical protein